MEEEEEDEAGEPVSRRVSLVGSAPRPPLCSAVLSRRLRPVPPPPAPAAEIFVLSMELHGLKATMRNLGAQFWRVNHASERANRRGDILHLSSPSSALMHDPALVRAGFCDHTIPINMYDIHMAADFTVEVSVLSHPISADLVIPGCSI